MNYKDPNYIEINYILYILKYIVPYIILHIICNKMEMTSSKGARFSIKIRAPKKI